MKTLLKQWKDKSQTKQIFIKNISDKEIIYPENIKKYQNSIII